MAFSDFMHSVCHLFTPPSGLKLLYSLARLIPHTGILPTPLWGASPSNLKGVTMMKSFAIALAVLFCLANPALAESGEPLRMISVTGTVETKAAPDMVVWRINLADENESLSQAKAASDVKVKAILALREKLGIKEGDLQTGTMSIRKEYHEDDRGRRLEFKHFRVYRSITIRQRDLKRFDEYIDAFVASAEMEVSFSFQCSTIHEVRAETRLKALKVAREKAEALAEVGGAKLGKVLSIDEHGPGNDRGFHSQLSNNAYSPPRQVGVDQASGTFVPGAIDVKMTIYATFELE